MQWSAKFLAPPYVREMSKYAWTEASRRNIRESYRTRERVYIKNLKLVMTVDIISLRRKCAGDQILLTGKRDDIANARKQFARRWRFQQDFDPKHRSRVATDFVNKKYPNF